MDGPRVQRAFHCTADVTRSLFMRMRIAPCVDRGEQLKNRWELRINVIMDETLADLLSKLIRKEAALQQDK